MGHLLPSACLSVLRQSVLVHGHLPKVGAGSPLFVLFPFRLLRCAPLGGAHFTDTNEGRNGETDPAGCLTRLLVKEVGL